MAATPEISNENCVTPPDDPVECASVNRPAVVDGGAEAVNSVKTDSTATSVAPVSSSNPEASYYFYGCSLLILSRWRGSLHSINMFLF